MGLSIHFLSLGKDADIDWGYKCLHEIRYLAAVLVGFKDDYDSFWKMEIGETKPDVEYARTMGKFPELLLHADSDGAYFPKTLIKSCRLDKSLWFGDSDELLKELDEIDKLLTNQTDSFLKKHEKEIELFKEFAAKVHDEVKGDDDFPDEPEGIITFG